MNRLVHVLRHEIFQQLRTIMITSGAVAGTILLFSMLNWVGGLDVVDLWPAYGPVMVIMGLLLTARSFSELKSPGRRIEYLLRPATVWEKVLGKLFVSTVVIWLAVTVAFLVATTVGVVLFLLLGGGLPAGEVFRTALVRGQWIVLAGETFLNYLPLQAVFFFGAVYFRGQSAGKTLLSVVGWISSYVFIAVFTVRIVFNRYFAGVVPHSGARRFGRLEGPLTHADIDAGMWREIAPFYLQNPELLRSILSVLLVVVFWSLTVLRLRETEA
jgi:hypothetical protein